MFLEARLQSGGQPAVLSAHKPFVRLLIAAGLWLVASAGYSHNAVPPASNLAPNAAAQAEALTQSLVDVSAQYRIATPADRGRLESSLLTTAASRLQVLASLMEDDPGAVLDAVLPAAVRSTLPSSLTAYLEQD